MNDEFNNLFSNNFISLDYGKSKNQVNKIYKTGVLNVSIKI